jgi:hypothetical protein
MAAERVAARAGLVTETQLHAGLRELFDPAIDIVEGAADVSVKTDLSGAARSDGHRRTFLVDVQADEVDNGAWVFGSFLSDRRPRARWILVRMGFVLTGGLKPE